MKAGATAGHRPPTTSDIPPTTTGVDEIARDHEGRTALWTLLGVVVAFKVGTGILIVLHAQPVTEAYDLLIATNLPLIPIILPLILGPIAFWIRLVRARAKRRSLEHAEWHV